MRVATPDEVAEKTDASKYVGVVVAARYARMLNEIPRVPGALKKKLTTRALEDLLAGRIVYEVKDRKAQASSE